MISTMQGIHEPFKDGNMRRHFGVLAFAASLVFAGVSQAEFSAGGDDNEAVVVRQAEPAVTDGVASEIPTDRFRVEPSGTDETSGSITVHSEPSAAVQSKAPILAEDQSPPTQSTMEPTSASTAPAEPSGTDQNEAAAGTPAEVSAIGDAIRPMPVTVLEAEPAINTGESDAAAGIQDPAIEDGVTSSIPASLAPAGALSADEEASVEIRAEPIVGESTIAAMPAGISQAAPSVGTDESTIRALAPDERFANGGALESRSDGSAPALNKSPGELSATAH